MWDDVLAQAPEYGDGYYSHGPGRSLAANGVGYLDRYIQDNLDAGSAISTVPWILGPAADGRNYRRRHVILTDLTGVTPFRANQDVLLELALENLQ